jgi:hypothetical protein
MSDEPSPAVLAEQIKADRHEREVFRQSLMETLARIDTQTTKTNGRVSRLEQWRWFLLGGFAALSMPAATKLAALFSAAP